MNWRKPCYWSEVYLDVGRCILKHNTGRDLFSLLPLNNAEIHKANSAFPGQGISSKAERRMY